MYNHGHRNAVAGRVPDLLESLKTEFESVSHDANLYKLRAEDFERKCMLMAPCSHFLSLLVFSSGTQLRN
jgi:hypothetical protein